MNDGISTFATIMLFFLALLGIASMGLFLYLGFLLLRAIKRSTRWFRTVERSVQTMPMYRGTALIQPRNTQRTHLSDGEVREVRSFLQRRRQTPQHIVEVREYDV